MTKHLRCAVGFLILAAPFIAMGAFVVIAGGWLVFLAVFGSVLLLLATIVLGVWLTEDCL